MKTIAALLCFGGSILLSACQPQITTEARSPLFAACSSMSIVTGSDFVRSKVAVLSSGFQPDLDYPQYQRPQGTSATNTIYAPDIAAAWEAAPPVFRDQLCSLSMVFINQCAANCTDINASWGYRERPDQFAPGYSNAYNEYVAITSAMWPSSSALTLDAYQSQLANILLGWNRLKYNPPTPAYQGQGVLAALAHEYGHILFYDMYKPDHVNFNYQNFCSDSFHSAWRHHEPPPKYRDFGDPDSEHTATNDASDPSGDSVSRLAFAVVQNKLVRAKKILDRIHALDGRWASLFAAFSPDEDFVETFGFYIMTHPTAKYPLKSLELYMSNANNVYKSVGDIPADDDPQNGGGKRSLDNKKACFTTKFG